MREYNRVDFEKEIKNKTRFLVRIGEFVGVYKYNFENKCLILTKPIIDSSYVKKNIIKVREKGNFEYDNEIIGCLVSVNEILTIPKKYDLRKKIHLLLLNSCLGGCYSDVKKRIDVALINYLNNLMGWLSENK